MKKSLADCHLHHLPFWFDTKLLNYYQCIQAGNKYIQKDSCFVEVQAILRYLYSIQTCDLDESEILPH